MKRLIAPVVLMALVVAAAVPAIAQNDSSVRYALAGEARALELAVANNGLTFGVALSEGDSTPKSAGLGAGQCDLLGSDADIEDAACNADSTERSKSPGNEGDIADTCATPDLPPQLDSLLAIDAACGFSQSGAQGNVPTTSNEGRVTNIELTADFSNVSGDLQQVKDDLIEGLEGVIGMLPPEAQNLLEEILLGLDTGNVGEIKVGRATSDIRTLSGGGVEVESKAGAIKIGLLGVPDLDPQGNPIPGTADPLTNGLIIIEVGDASSTASISGSDFGLSADADAALIRVKIRDITQVTPTYIEEEVAPGETQIILEGTPAESTITAADTNTEVTSTVALAASDAVSLHLLQGNEFMGGIRLGLARTTAAASLAQDPNESPSPSVKPTTEVSPKELPATGADNRLPIALVMIAAAALVLVLRRRFAR